MKETRIYDGFKLADVCIKYGFLDLYNAHEIGKFLAGYHGKEVTETNLQNLAGMVEMFSVKDWKDISIPERYNLIAGIILTEGIVSVVEFWK